MEKSVENRTEKYSDNRKECNARKECIERSENFPSVRLHLIDWSHPSENHRGIQKGIDPADIFDVVVSRDTKTETKCDQEDGKKCSSHYAPEEFFPTE
jgi:hypothetical protein